MPGKRARKSWSNPLQQQRPVSEIPRNPSKMPEPEDLQHESPPPSRSPSPSTSKCLDREQLQESEEATKDPPREVRESLHEHAHSDVEPEEIAIPSSPKIPVPAREARSGNTLSRKTQGKKTKSLSDKQRAKIQEKLDLLEKNLRPVPFFPAKIIDFAEHERLFKTLGLWDFAHLELSGPIRADLLTQLIASYDQSARRSRVNGVRIAVARPDLARALGLQWKKEKAASSENKDTDRAFLSEDESVAIIMDFMSNWILLHEEDACILPGEVMAATQLVREGQALKVDWSALIWTMVEKELLEAPISGFCYYASHLQCLMKHQKPGIFELQEPDATEAPVLEQQHDANGMSLCLSLGADDNGEDHWLPGTKSTEDEHYLRRCSLNDEDGDHYVDEISTKFSNLEGITSTDLLQAINTVDVPYSIPPQSMEPSIELLVSRHDHIQSLELDTCMPSSSLLKTISKREIDEIDDDDDDDDEANDITHFSHGNHPKKMRVDGSWDQSPLTIDKCIDEAQSWIEKAKMFVSQREQESTSAQIQIQYMNSLLQQKEHHIQLLEKNRVEEQQQRQMEICRFEHELMVMARIIHGYRKTLSETRHAFAEYRKQYPRGDEQLYKDDDGGHGDVVSMKELERRRILKEEERCIIMQMIDSFTSIWIDKFHGYEDRVDQLETRLLNLAKTFDHFRKNIASGNGTEEKSQTAASTSPTKI